MHQLLRAGALQNKQADRFSVQHRAHWAMYNPASHSWQEGLPHQISRTLKRRYFLVEKAKNASVVGGLPVHTVSTADMTAALIEEQVHTPTQVCAHRLSRCLRQIAEAESRLKIMSVWLPVTRPAASRASCSQRPTCPQAVLDRIAASTLCLPVNVCADTWLL